MPRVFHPAGQVPRPDRAIRRRRPLLAGLLAVLGLGGLVLAGFGISGQVMPRRFTAAQRERIEAWDIARRWRTTPKTKIFPARVRYRLGGGEFGLPGSMALTARRLGIARQASCQRAAGTSHPLVTALDRDGCQAVLRATYTDATSSLVLTVGIAVLGSQRSAASAARLLTGDVTGEQSPGAVSKGLVLRPVPVPDSPASAFGAKQRQVAWVVGSGSYLVLATAGYANSRPKVPVASDSYTYLEMTSLARGVAADIAAPFAAPPPVPRCPGAPGC